MPLKIVVEPQKMQDNKNQSFFLHNKTSKNQRNMEEPKTDNKQKVDHETELDNKNVNNNKKIIENKKIVANGRVIPNGPILDDGKIQRYDEIIVNDAPNEQAVLKDQVIQNGQIIDNNEIQNYDQVVLKGQDIQNSELLYNNDKVVFHSQIIGTNEIQNYDQATNYDLASVNTQLKEERNIVEDDIKIIQERRFETHTETSHNTSEIDLTNMTMPNNSDIRIHQIENNVVVINEENMAFLNNYISSKELDPIYKMAILRLIDFLFVTVDLNILLCDCLYGLIANNMRSLQYKYDMLKAYLRGRSDQVNLAKVSSIGLTRLRSFIFGLVFEMDEDSSYYSYSDEEIMYFDSDDLADSSNIYENSDNSSLTAESDIRVVDSNAGINLVSRSRNNNPEINVIRHHNRNRNNRNSYYHGGNDSIGTVYDFLSNRYDVLPPLDGEDEIRLIQQTYDPGIRLLERHDRVMEINSLLSVLRGHRFRLSSKEIKKLKVYKYKNKIEKNDDTCSICFSDFVKNSVVMEIKCGHFFHKKCIKPWLTRDRKCPLCRNDSI